MSVRKSDEIEVFLQFVGDNPLILRYLHNTESLDIAKKIMQNGFRFEKYLENTTDLISRVDEVELKYFLHRRSYYGAFSMVINISKELAEYYTQRLQNTPFHFTEVLHEKEIEISMDNEPIYTLPTQFVKGYYNHVDKSVVYNPLFEPNYDTFVFEKNADRLNCL